MREIKGAPSITIVVVPPLSSINPLTPRRTLVAPFTKISNLF